MEGKFSKSSKMSEAKLNDKSLPLQSSPNRELKIKIVIGMLSVVIILLGLGLMYFAYLFNNSQKMMIVDDKSNANVVMDESSESEGIMDDSMKDWKTYTNEEFGFSFKYPDYLNIQDQSEEEIVWNAYYKTLGSTMSAAMTLHSQRDMFDPLKKGNKITLNNVTKNIVEVMGIDEDKEIRLDQRPATRYTFFCGVDCLYHVVRFDSGESSNELIFYGAGGGLIRKFDQILSTFKFTDNPYLQVLLPGQKKYVSEKLSVEFLYMEKMSLGDSEKIAVKEIGNKIYLYPSNLPVTLGQYIEIFNKDPKKTLGQTLQGDFLTTAEFKLNCKVTNNTLSSGNGVMYPNSYEKGNIQIIAEFENVDQMLLNLERCPVPYTQSNGISYFLYDTNHPSKYAFISVGQYAINADSENLTWQDTIRFID